MLQLNGELGYLVNVHDETLKNFNPENVGQTERRDEHYRTRTARTTGQERQDKQNKRKALVLLFCLSHVVSVALYEGFVVNSYS